MKNNTFSLMASAAVISSCIFVASAGAAPGANNNNEQGSTNGQPFQSVQDEIDALEASLQNEVDCINDYLNGTTNAAGPCEDYSGSIIEDLEARVADLEQDVDALESTVANAQCPAGWSIRQLDPLICEFDSTINDRLIHRRYFGPLVTGIPYRRSGTARAYCGSGFTLTGCGHSASGYLNISSSYSLGNSCLVRAFHSSYTYRFSRGSVRAFADCAMASPSP